MEALEDNGQRLANRGEAGAGGLRRKQDRLREGERERNAGVTRRCKRAEWGKAELQRVR